MMTACLITQSNASRVEQTRAYFRRRNLREERVASAANLVPTSPCDHRGERIDAGCIDRESSMFPTKRRASQLSLPNPAARQFDDHF